MRAHVAVAAVVLFGCASRPKRPAVVEGSAVQEVPRAVDASAPDPSPAASTAGASVAPSTPDPSPTPDPSSTPDPPPPPGERRPTTAEARECAARHGTIQPICMAGELACVVRYRDGGKRCTDKRDCTGECLYDGPDPPPPKAAGSCQRTSDPCGCKALVHHGQVEPTLCAD